MRKYNERKKEEYLEDSERKEFEEYRYNMVSKLIDDIETNLGCKEDTNKTKDILLSRLNTMDITKLIDDYTYEGLHRVIKQSGV